MNNFYKITTGQLVTCWIFGAISFVIFGNMAENGDSVAAAVLGIGIPFFLIFYTLGWRMNR